MKIVFMGTPSAAVPSLDALVAHGHEIAAVYTQPDRPAGRGNKVVYSPVKEFALAHGLVVEQPSAIRAADAYARFQSFYADLAVVVAYGRILPERFLNAFPYGAVNVHFSLLPKYRGAAPVNWAIANAETESGVTTMKMDAGLDTGPILLQRSVEIGPDETAVDLMTRLSNDGADLLIETVQGLDALEPQPQDESRATYAPILGREDGRIDWNRPAAEIANRVRAFQPFPTSFTFLNGIKVTIWRASAVEAAAAGSPGEIMAANRSGLVVNCGGNTNLKIDELQPEGKRRMSAQDFINGFRPTEAMHFGTENGKD